MKRAAAPKTRKKEMQRIGHSRPTVRGDDYRALERVLASGWLAQGAEVKHFERELSAFIGVGHGACVSSGTAALHLALRALGLGEGDTVAVPGYCCASVLDGVRLAGCRPLLVDVDPRSMIMDVDDLKRKMKRGGSAVVIVHLLGYPGPVRDAVSMPVPVVEDLAQSLGAVTGGRRVGSFATASVCSFYATKLITTGEGGMVLSDDGGVTTSVGKMRSSRDHSGEGSFPYPMSDLQAALGRSQLGGLEKFLEKRRTLSELYRNALDVPGLRFIREPEDGTAANFRFVVSVPGRDPGDIIERMDSLGIECRRPFEEPLYRFLGEENLPGCREAYESLISLPLYPSLDESLVMRIAGHFRETTSRRNV